MTAENSSSHTDVAMYSLFVSQLLQAALVIPTERVQLCLFHVSQSNKLKLIARVLVAVVAVVTCSG